MTTYKKHICTYINLFFYYYVYIPEVCCVKGPVLDVSEDEVEKAQRAMKTNKVPGPSGVSSDLLKCAG